jgi:hypothetical protein
MKKKNEGGGGGEWNGICHFVHNKEVPKMYLLPLPCLYLT